MKLSILTIVKNDKKNLLVSIKSILSQNFKNFEHIIYDAMSNDGTKFIIKKYLSKNVKYICRKDKNYYEGLNYAIRVSSGEYIGILNAGDKYFDATILEKIYKKILATKCDLLFGNLIYYNNKNYYKRIWKFTVESLNRFSALKIASPTLFIKKKILLSNPYNTNYSISSDTDLNLRLSKKNLHFVYLNKYIILMKTGGLSTNFKFFLKKLMQDILIFKKHFKIFFLFIYLYKIFFKLKTFKLIKLYIN
jgi:glycosyltransferase